MSGSNGKPAAAAGTIPVGRHVRVHRMGFGGTRPTGPGIRREPRAPRPSGVVATALPPGDAPHASAGRRIVLADDDVLFREGLASLLDRSGFDVVGQAGQPDHLVSLVSEQRPQLVIVDIQMAPGQSTDALDAARLIRRDFPEVAILVLSAHVELEDAMELLATGERVGYLTKSRVTDVAEFVDTVERFAHGISVVDPALVGELFAARHRNDRLGALTRREREVLALMAEGSSNAGIAHRLWITEGTVEKHVSSILTKLQPSDTPDDHRRVLAVIAFLECRQADSPSAP